MSKQETIAGVPSTNIKWLKENLKLIVKYQRNHLAELIAEGNLEKAIKQLTTLHERVEAYLTATDGRYLTLTPEPAPSVLPGGDLINKIQDIQEMIDDGWFCDNPNMSDVNEEIQWLIDRLLESLAKQESPTAAPTEVSVCDSTETPELAEAAKRCEMNYDSSDSWARQTVRFHRYWAFVHGANWAKALKLSAESLTSKPAKECVTHHHACDCREAMFKERIAELEEEIINSNKFAQDQEDKIAELEKENAELKAKL